MNTDPLVEELLELLTMPMDELEELARGSWCQITGGDDVTEEEITR